MCEGRANKLKKCKIMLFLKFNKQFKASWQNYIYRVVPKSSSRSKPSPLGPQPAREIGRRDGIMGATGHSEGPSPHVRLAPAT